MQPHKKARDEEFTKTKEEGIARARQGFEDLAHCYKTPGEALAK